MLNEIKKTDAFYDYYEKWIAVYKKGAVRDVTLDKYHLTHQWIGKLAPDLKLCENLPRVERGVVYFLRVVLLTLSILERTHFRHT